MSSEKALAHVHHVVRPYGVVQVRTRFGRAIAIAAEQAEATLGPAYCGAAALGNGLTDRHPALNAVRARPLHLAIDVEHRHPVDVDDIAANYEEIVLQLVVEEHGGNVDFLSERLCVSHTGENRDIGAGGGDTSGYRYHFGETGIKGLERETTGVANLPENGNLITADLRRHDCNLGLLNEAAGFQCIRYGRLGGSDSHATNLHHSDHREGYRAIFGDTCLQGQIGILIDLNTHYISWPELIFRLLVLSLSGNSVANRREDQPNVDEMSELHNFPNSARR